MTLAAALFYLTAVVAVGGALGVVFFRQAMRSVLSLVVVMLALSVDFLLLNAQFVFAVQIIVYAGAVMVLFLFVVALLGPVTEKPSGRLPLQPWVATIFALAFGVVAVSLISGTRYLAPAKGVSLDLFGSVQTIAEGLFKTYLYPFELTSLLLLMAAVGAIYLSRRDTL